MGFSMDLPDVEAVKEEVKVERAPKPETEDKLEKIADIVLFLYLCRL